MKYSLSEVIDILRSVDVRFLLPYDLDVDLRINKDQYQSQADMALQFCDDPYDQYCLILLLSYLKGLEV